MSSDTRAQDSFKLNEDNKSVIAFDIQIDALAEQAGKLGFDLTMFDSNTSPIPWGRVKLGDVERIVGAVSKPANVKEASSGWSVGGKLVYDFFCSDKV